MQTGLQRVVAPVGRSRRSRVFGTPTSSSIPITPPCSCCYFFSCRGAKTAAAYVAHAAFVPSLSVPGGVLASTFGTDSSADCAVVQFTPD
ncbi:hypothetical protein INT45_003609 [Circinella minor]|uniref:Uncharacterized protein n=1 Tax=Circinella minor TaxID=1195481 RepID=A0A8H7VIX9_9FUNG|nr:hypothetical protein INT45_003609 [Circinella minor]